MPYRQPWETGHAHVTELRHAAARERSYRAATRTQTSTPTRTPTRLRTSLAAVARTVADQLSRFADRLDTRPARFVPSRPDGA